MPLTTNKQTNAGQSLNGSNHQILKGLSTAFGFRLIDFKKCMETWILGITLLQRLFHLFEEIYVGRVRFDQSFSMIEYDLTD